MQAKVSQWGNSLAIRLPQAIVQELSIVKGDALELHSEDNGFSVKIPSTPKKYNLNELVDCITQENQHDEIDWGTAQGKEVW